MSKIYYVYIMASREKVIYVGVTNDLQRRVYEHKNKEIEGFTKKYNINKLVWFDETDDIASAIEAEKKIKGWSRKKKNDLIKRTNLKWKDLAENWY